MAISYGKQFEQKVKQDLRRIDGVSFLRLPDQFTGYKNSYNPCDCIIYKYPTLIYAEIKSRKGNIFSFNDFAQYDRLLEHSNIKGVYPTVIIWFIDHDEVLAFPILSIEKMKQDGLKSINIKNYKNYEHIKIPSIKKRFFMDSDYSYMFDYYRAKEV